MKINVMRQLLSPWVLLFVAIIIFIVVGGVKFHIDLQASKYFKPVLGIFVFACFYLNFRTISRAGIWIAHAVPKYFQYEFKNWISTITFCVVVGFYFIGQLSWVPLFWQGFVVPVASTIGLVILLRSIMGPVLTLSSRVAFTRVTALVLSIPIFAIVPVGGIFLGDTVLKAFMASQPETAYFNNTSVVLNIKKVLDPLTLDSKTKDLNVNFDAEIPNSDRAEKFKELALSKRSCPLEQKTIQFALNPRTSDEILYWAIKASHCVEMKASVGMARFVEIMLKAKNPKVRAAAIYAMPRFGNTEVRRMSYLLLKRIQEKEDPEVIKAAATILFRLGESESKYTTARIKGLLAYPELSTVTSEVLVKVIDRSDVLVEHILASLSNKSASQAKTIGMICSLGEKEREAFVPHIQEILGAIQSGDKQDQALRGLECLGAPGVKALREELVQAKVLKKEIAAKTLYEMNIEHSKEVLDSMSRCVGDINTDVRKWCSQGLGKIGTPALPKIVELLKSTDEDFKKSGEQAMQAFQDPMGKTELLRLRSENSGWMVNRRKLQVANAIDTALLRLKDTEVH